MQHIHTSRIGQIGGSTTTRPRLMLVDDEHKPLLTYGLALQQQFPGYDIVMALGPKRALEEVSANPDFAGIISNIPMPDVDGPDLLASSAIYSKGEDYHRGLFRLIVSPTPGYQPLETSVQLPELATPLNVHFRVCQPVYPSAFAYAVHELLEQLYRPQHRFIPQRSEMIDGHIIPQDISDLFHD